MLHANDSAPPRQPGSLIPARVFHVPIGRGINLKSGRYRDESVRRLAHDPPARADRRPHGPRDRDHRKEFDRYTPTRRSMRRRNPYNWIEKRLVRRVSGQGLVANETLCLCMSIYGYAQVSTLDQDFSIGFGVCTTGRFQIDASAKFRIY
jgi:hypothetical protein